MVYVPSAKAYGFSLRLNEDVMREVLNGSGVKRTLSELASDVQGSVVAHVHATASARDATNYVTAMFAEDAFSDDYGFDFDGPYSLGNRHIAVVGVRSGRGADKTAKPPLLVESETHSLTSVQGFTVGEVGEDIR